MSKLNNSMRNVVSLTDKACQDMAALTKEYQALSDDIKTKLKEEVAYLGSFDGLEVFNNLNRTVQRNLGSIKNAYYLLKRMRDISGFDVSEIEEEIINGDISKLLKK